MIRRFCFVACAAWSCQAATLCVDPDTRITLKTGPHKSASIDRNIYFRTYHIPGMFNEALAEELAELRISPGRGTGPYFGHNGGDRQRAGWDPDLPRQLRNYAEFYRNADKRYPGAPHALGGGNYPEFTKTENRKLYDTDESMVDKHRKGIPPEDFEECADLVVQWLETLQTAKVTPPRWFSPLNEPDGNWRNSPNPSQDQADFSRLLALQLKDRFPETGISGPCTAWPHPRGDFRRWTDSGWEKQFIETCGDVAAAYDFHLYSAEQWALENPLNDSPNFYNSYTNGNFFVWDFGKADAFLDLVYAHHQAFWNEPSLPVIITEFGRQNIFPQKGPWENDINYYLFGTTVTRIWMQLMQRPEVQLTVPFILPISDPGYAPRRGQAMYTRNENGNPVKTPLFDFYRFFQSLEGERVKFQWLETSPEEQLGLTALPMRHANRLMILLHNAFDAEKQIHLETGGTKSARAARMRWQNNRWRIDLQPLEKVDASRLILQPEETMIVYMDLPDSGKSARQTIERFYSRDTLKSLQSGKARVTIELPHPVVGRATAVPTLSCPNGFTPGSTLTLKINGFSQSVELDFTAGTKDLFIPLHFELPDGILEKENTFHFILKSPKKWKASLATLRVELVR
ncbi:hypothetical protein [Pontiella agarivorans]|uniref:Beta-porphyranase A n=1 Tax=Pontiella agarivorans TaxID=3038953 RepID=A0ABU5MW40_9BACT|nr:hypothetical protein [Pontiella agarivorans]MDZ8118444.1 hypothetical protein [Pontiella agarivorans]